MSFATNTQGSQSLDYRAAVEKLVAIEREVDVNGFQYQGVCVWPVVRLLLWPRLLQEEGARQATATQPKSLVRSCFAAAAGYLRAALIFPVIQVARMNLPEAQLAQLRKQRGRHEILFFTMPKENQEVFDGQHYNRFADPFIDFFAQDISISKVEIVNHKTNETMPRRHEGMYLRPDTTKLSVKLIRQNRVRDWDFMSQAIKRICGFSLEEEAVIRTMEAVISYENLFREVFSILRPKAVFIVCYYHSVAFGLIKACRTLGITTVDYQHGKQGKFHGMYTHWTAMPRQGYELLPDWFWVWGEESKDNIERHQPAEIVRHPAVVGGSLWLSGWVHEKIHMDVGQERELEELLAGRKAILFSLQPLDNPIPEFCLEAMAKSPREWIWLLRTHPLYRDRINEIETMLRARGVSNGEVRLASAIPLFALLKKSSHHVTAFSSVCYEALAFGLRTTLFHPTAKNLYENYLEEDLFTFADSAESLLDAIEKSLITSPPVESNPYIMTDIATIQSAMHEVMQ